MNISRFINSFVVFLLCCSTFSFAQETLVHSLTQELEGDASIIFKTTLTTKKDSYSGLLVFKKKGKETKVVLVTPVGMKFFEFTIAEDSLYFSYLAPFLDNKGLKFVLSNDLNVLANPKVLSISGVGKHVLRLNKRKTKYYVNEAGQLCKVIQKQSLAGKARTSLIYDESNRIIGIEVVHKRINFVLQLNRV